MRRKHEATIRIGLSSSNLAVTIYRALKPELDAKAQMTVEDGIVTLNLEASTVSTLRALTNSYLRWIATICNTIDTVNSYLN
ncbi:MAG: KEOPS complex subunit Pcc1 [Candidatus Bathyarchaeota archaeon]